MLLQKPNASKQKAIHYNTFCFLMIIPLAE
jgi:hypothetical protein